MNDIVGKQFRYLKVIKCVGKGKWNKLLYLCMCVLCGSSKVAKRGDLVTNSKRHQVKSCGCLWKKSNGMSRSRTYSCWAKMISRCVNSNHPSFHNYGGRGIKVCKKWTSFKEFYKDMGDVPVGKSIERVDNNGSYNPENCKWATVREQSLNRRTNRILCYGGKRRSLSEWSEKLKIPRTTIHNRLMRGWSINDALS